MTGMVSVPWWVAVVALLVAMASGGALAVVGVSWLAAGQLTARRQAGAQGDGDGGEGQ